MEKLSKRARLLVLGKRAFGARYEGIPYPNEVYSRRTPSGGAGVVVLSYSS